MALKINIGMRGILISAIVLIISVLLLIDRLLATGPVQLILEDGGKDEPCGCPAV
jgi:hypothetical protein